MSYRACPRTPLRCHRRIAIPSDRRRVDDLLTLIDDGLLWRFCLTLLSGAGLLQGRIYWRRRCNGSATPFIGPASHHGLSIVVLEEPTNVAEREVVVRAERIGGSSVDHKGVLAKVGSAHLEVGARWRTRKRRANGLEGIIKFVLPSQGHLWLKDTPPLAAEAQAKERGHRVSVTTGDFECRATVVVVLGEAIEVGVRHRDASKRSERN